MISLVLLWLALQALLLALQVRGGATAFRRLPWYSWEGRWTIADRDTTPIGFWFQIAVQSVILLLLIRVVYLIVRL
ncbi:MAG TPA: hypothetical protein VML55_11525 [Planctomycetaceae bacterium]|nr:hypothetical protein [Planctomycetaceae bacterium]